jgi:signal transduction histidine kinase
MKNLREKTGIHFSLTASAAVEGLNTATRTVLYRVAQEALTNVIRHAHASRAKVTVQKIRQQVRLKIADNGRGFSPRRGLTAKRNARLGLIGMRERLEMVGGKLTIDSTPGKGTIIVASVPV